jgi:hypothetical protein
VRSPEACLASRKGRSREEDPVALLALAVAFAAACAPKVNDPADVQAIKDTGPAYDKFANAGDAASLASEFYAPDAIRVDPNQPASAGTAAVHGLWTEKSSLNGKDTSGTYRYTDTFIKRDGRWQAVATFTTKLR